MEFVLMQFLFLIHIVLCLNFSSWFLEIVLLHNHFCLRFVNATSHLACRKQESCFRPLYILTYNGCSVYVCAVSE